MRSRAAASRRVRGIPTILVLSALLMMPAAVSADPGDTGQQGPSGTGAGAAPSGSKPEAKLWFNDGRWWGSLWDSATSDFYIWSLDPVSDVWSRTNTRLDERVSSRADVLWDGTKLYVASHQFSESNGSGQSRLYRFSYDTFSDTYSIDAGFPVVINSVKSETLVIAKDSSGQLWATWEAGGSIWVNRSTTGDNVWGTPFVLPGAAGVNGDDISSVIAFGGDRIGIFWSNQSASPDADYFAVHDDIAADTTWNAPEIAYAGANVADDHLNLKTDASGRVYAVVKTSLGGSNPLIALLVRSASGTWSLAIVSNATLDHTRPILVIDEANELLRVYLTSSGSGGSINEKTSPIEAISFSSGQGTVVMKDASANKINNPSSSKQNANAATGLVVLGFNDTTKFYWHAVIIPVGAEPPNSPPVVYPTSATTTSEVPVPVSLAGTDVETCDLAFSIVDAPTHGTLSAVVDAGCVPGSPNGDSATITYTPSQGYSGPDAFTYRANDGTSDSAIESATLTVDPVVDLTPPSLSSITVTGATLSITYDEAIDPASVPTSGDYAAMVGGEPRAVTDVAISGSAVALTLESPVAWTDTITLSWQPGSSPIRDIAGNEAAGFSDAVATNLTQPPDPVVVTVFPTDDAQVKSTSPNTNYGADPSIRVREESGGVSYRSYLKFSIVGLTGTVLGAQLRLFVTDASVDSGSVYLVDPGWSESTITYNTAPAIGTTAIGNAGTTTVGTWVTIDLGTAVTGNGTIAFALRSASTNSAIFNSSESALSPELVITQTP